jgi:hypothetical protein
LGQMNVLEDARTHLIEKQYLYVGHQATEAVRQRARGLSLRRVLVEDVTLAALHHARAVGVAVDMYRELAGKGCDLIDRLQSAASTKEAINFFETRNHTDEWDFWKHESKPFVAIKSGKGPRIDRERIEHIASDYLALPYRAPQFERTIIDVLTAAELYAYGDEMVRKPDFVPIPFLPKRSPLHERHVLSGYLIGTFWEAVILLGLAYLSVTLLPQSLGGWVGPIFVGLFLLAFALDTAFLPWRWRHQRKRRKKVVDLLRLMINTYGELDSNAVVSTRRLRELVSKAADAGVVWPSPLLAVLDDNITRIGRLERVAQLHRY